MKNKLTTLFVTGSILFLLGSLSWLAYEKYVAYKLSMCADLRIDYYQSINTELTFDSARCERLPDESKQAECLQAMLDRTDKEMNDAKTYFESQGCYEN